MRTFLLSCLLCLTLLPLAGCAFMNEEDRDFYGKGWVKPTELDRDNTHYTRGDPGELGTPAHTSSRPTPVFPTGY